MNLITIKKVLISAVFAAFITMNAASPAWAGYTEAGASASLKNSSQSDFSEYRVLILRNFLNRYNSPLTPYAPEFVRAADEYGIDFRLVASITGVESTFGKRIPAGSYNAYGWANGDYRFASWEDSINHVSKTLKEKYINKGAVSIPQIARRYAPPSTTWGGNVKFFMGKIDPLPLNYDL